MNPTTRRSFLQQTATAAIALAGLGLSSEAAERKDIKTVASHPWYRRTLRWGQTNITEIDPARYDIGWWRQHWKRAQTQGVIINAGGIVAYYPSRVPLHRQARQLEGRDLFGELCRAAHEDGLAVFARMDSNRAHEEFFRAHPDWFAMDAAGKPHQAGELFITCVNGPYYDDHIPAIMREIVELYHPEGFTDNSWSGQGRGAICYCENCRRKFRERSGKDIPRGKDWNDQAYREWILWNYDRRLEIWDLNNRTTKAAGGPDCIWAGMNSGSISGQCQSFRDCKEICRRADIIMLDHQSRGDASGFQNNGEAGKLIHGLLGWDKLVPESMALYQAGRPTFRLASKPEPEARMWMLDGKVTQGNVFSPDGSHLVVCQAGIFSVYNISNAASPQLIGTFTGSGSEGAMFYRDYLLMSGRGAGTTIWKVGRTPAELTKIQTLPCYFYNSKYFVEGDRIFTNAEGVDEFRLVPRLSASRSGGQVAIDWEGVGTLESAPAIEGPWDTIPNAVNPHLSINESSRLFRVKIQ